MDDKTLQDKYDIKIIKSIFYSRVFAVGSLRQPFTPGLIMFFHGTEWGHLSLALPVIFPLFFLALGLNAAITWTLIYFYILFFLRIHQFYTLKKEYANSDYDFIVTTTKGGSEPKLEDISQQGGGVFTSSSMRGFKNGLRFVLMTNVNFDLAVDNLAVDTEPKNKTNVSISKLYFKLVAGFYRSLRII